MEKKAVSGIMITFLLISMLTLAFNIQQVKAETRTWTVDDDGPANFHTIQEAINMASEGDTISVYSGTYYENVVVNKTVSLNGMNRNTTVIDGNGAGHVMTIEADWANISGFSVTSGDSAIYFPRYVSNIRIINCNIYNNYIGVCHSGPTSQTNVISCNIFNNEYGVSLAGSSHVVEGCNIFSNDFVGIQLATPSHNCVITNSSLWSNRDLGAISVAVSSDHVIKNSYIFNNTRGVSFVSNGINTVLHHTVTNCEISNNIYGIYLSGTSFINITNCEISNNKWGLCVLPYSRDNFIHHNSFINNTNQATDESTNSWNKNYPSGGNYWSDYTGLDLYKGPYQNETGSDGIGDTSYPIDVENEDKYPLMDPCPLLDLQKTNYEFYGLLANYKKLELTYESSYHNLNATYNDLLANYASLQAELNDLQSEYDSLANELNITRNIMYVSLAITIVFIAATVYLAIGKSKAKIELTTT